MKRSKPEPELVTLYEVWINGKRTDVSTSKIRAEKLVSEAMFVGESVIELRPTNPLPGPTFTTDGKTACVNNDGTWYVLGETRDRKLPLHLARFLKRKAD